MSLTFVSFNVTVTTKIKEGSVYPNQQYSRKHLLFDFPCFNVTSRNFESMSNAITAVHVCTERKAQCKTIAISLHATLL